MNKPPRVSVIVPCYNTAAYLPGALDSLLAQQVLPYEVLVIDDGSTDTSAAIAEGYGGIVTCIRHSHQGIAASRNAGVQQAQGDFIAFLDADDYWPTDSLSARLAAFADTPALDGVFGLIEAFVSPELSVAEQQQLAELPGIQSGRLAGALLVRRSVFARIGGFNGEWQVGETMDWIARAQERDIAFGHVGSVVLRRRIHTVNTVRKTQCLQSDYLHILHAAMARRRADPGPQASTEA